MYILKLEENKMIFAEGDYNKEERKILLKYTGYFEEKEIKQFILEVLEKADGNPVRINIPLNDTFVDCIAQLGLQVSDKGYLYTPYSDVKPYELTAIKLLRDEYTVKLNKNNVEIC